jgi:hypothetical protein
MSDEDKYLNPETNPMIPKHEKTKETPWNDADVLAPMEILEHNLTPKTLTEKLSSAFPNQNEIEVGRLTLERMADGGYREKGTGISLTDFPLSDLQILNDFVQDKRTS